MRSCIFLLCISISSEKLTSANEDGVVPFRFRSYLGSGNLKYDRLWVWYMAKAWVGRACMSNTARGHQAARMIRSSLSGKVSLGDRKKLLYSSRRILSLQNRSGHQKSLCTLLICSLSELLSTAALQLS